MRWKTQQRWKSLKTLKDILAIRLATREEYGVLNLIDT
jgi:hypothetical protein